MGWFLSSNTSKTKKKTTRGKSSGPSWDPKRTLLGMKFAGFAGGAIAVAIGWHYATEELEAYVNAEYVQPISAEDVRFSDDDRGMMSPSELNRIRAEVAGLIGDEPVNGDGLKVAAEYLRGQHDIVRELRQVQRTQEGTIEVDLDFRDPAALVLMRYESTGEFAQDGYHVIDDLGFQMYGPRFKRELPPNLPVIRGVSSKFRPKDNQGEHQWQGQEIAAGLALLEALSETPAIDLIESIDVYDSDDRGRIRLWLVTKGVECQILWGLPPGQEKGIEVDTDRKLKLLMSVLANGNYQTGQWRTVSINTGTIVPRQ